MEGSLGPSDDVKRAAGEALDHAGDLLDAADLLCEAFPHLAYHFGALALEEIGRSSMIVMNELAQRGEDPTGRFEDEARDHVRKLWWALWGPTMGREVITAQQIEEYQGLAQQIHDLRQTGLYYGGLNAPSPREAIDVGAALQIIGLARAGLGLARAHKWVVLEDDRAADMRWFTDATADPESRRHIMSGASMKKLSELGSVSEWIGWLRREFEAADAAALELAQQEMNRGQPGEGEELEPKFRMKLRFESMSHSVRPGPLQRWNDGNNWIKLHPVPNDRRQLIVELTIPKRVPIDELWWMGHRVANLVLVALNIGSLGLFWWRLPESVSRFYEELVDLESGHRLVVERAPALRIDWGNNALTNDELNRISISLAALTKFAEEHERRPFDRYLTGLGFLAKTDVIIQFEANAFEQFYYALREAERLFGRWDGTGSFVDHFAELAGPYFESDDDRDAYLGKARLIEEGRPQELRVGLSEVAAIKVLADSVFLRRFREFFEEFVAERPGEQAGQPDP